MAKAVLEGVAVTNTTRGYINDDEVLGKDYPHLIFNDDFTEEDFKEWLRQEELVTLSA